ncbi:hypothetical protein MASR2M52_15070 [Pedobacter sp.]
MCGVKGYEPYYATQRGKFVVAEDGGNEWINDEKGSHAYLIEKMDAKKVEALIEKTMSHQPIKK